MLGAALLAIVQDDIKRVLAYSTLSQLAYMIAGLSLGPEGLTAGFFHLFTHAFFKALLFLGAGFGDPRRALQQHERHGRAAEEDAHHVLDDADRLARAGRHLPVRRLLVEGRAAGGRLRDRHNWLFVVVLGHGAHHGLLHGAHGAAHVLRRLPRARRSRTSRRRPWPARWSSWRPARSFVGLLGAPQLGAVFGKWVFFDEIHEADVRPVDRPARPSARWRAWVWATRSTRSEGRGPDGVEAGSAVERVPASVLHRRVLHAARSSTPFATRGPAPSTGSTRTCWTPS